MSLHQLGATAGILSNFRSYAAAGCIPGRVAVSIRDEYRVLIETGEVRAEPAGALLYGAQNAADLPAVGDWVALRMVGDGDAIVHAVLPRTTRFSRAAAGRRTGEQIIAANVDTAFIVCGLDGDYNVRRLERYITAVHESGARGVVVLTKSDVCEDVPFKVERSVAAAPGVPVIAVSSLSDEGLAPIGPYLEPGKTFVLVGSSGAGKSTLLNRLLAGERQRTAPVRESDSRGRHTTSHRELVILPSGAIVIDTPGLRELGLWASEDSLDHTFEDVAALAGGCRYRDCSHTTEDGCAVLAAVASGGMETGRLESYLKLQREIRRHELLVDKQAAAVEKQRQKTMMKAMRAHHKTR